MSFTKQGYFLPALLYFLVKVKKKIQKKLVKSTNNRQVAPLEKRPSTDKLHQFFLKKKKYKKKSLNISAQKLK